MERPSDLVRQSIKARDYKKALKYAKTFRLGIKKEEAEQMTRAFECMNNPSFYEQIGYDPEGEIEKGIEIVERLYSSK